VLPYSSITGGRFGATNHSWRNSPDVPSLKNPTTTTQSSSGYRVDSQRPTVPMCDQRTEAEITDGCTLHHLRDQILWAALLKELLHQERQERQLVAERLRQEVVGVQIA
jgi:hypothetical protein